MDGQNLNKIYVAIHSSSILAILGPKYQLPKNLSKIRIFQKLIPMSLQLLDVMLNYALVSTTQTPESPLSLPRYSSSSQSLIRILAFDSTLKKMEDLL